VTIADELAAVERIQNNGRGVSCVRSIIACLRASGDMDRPKAIVWNEFDKLRNYPDIVDVLRKHGLTHEVDEMHKYVRETLRSQSEEERKQLEDRKELSSLLSGAILALGKARAKAAQDKLHDAMWDELSALQESVAKLRRTLDHSEEPHFVNIRRASAEG